MVKCKYLKQKYNYTPNDYDLTFNYQEVPKNIKWSGAADVEALLNRNAPLSKKIFLTMNIMEQSTINTVKITSYVTLKNENETVVYNSRL